MSIPSIVVRGRGFGGIPALVTHGLESSTTPTPTPTPSGLLGGGGPLRKHHNYSYIAPYQKYREESEALDRERASVEREAEDRRKKLSEEIEQTEILSRQLDALDIRTREEINRLLAEKAALVRRIDDEEALLVLMLSNPFI
jgi:hypothetical protein